MITQRARFTVISAIVGFMLFAPMFILDGGELLGLKNVFAKCDTDCGGGGGGTTLWTRIDNTCTITTTYTVCYGSICVSVSSTRNGTVINCIAGGQQQCQAQACQ